MLKDEAKPKSIAKGGAKGEAGGGIVAQEAEGGTECLSVVNLGTGRSTLSVVFFGVVVDPSEVRL